MNEEESPKIPKFSDLVKKFMKGTSPREVTKIERDKIKDELNFIFGKVFHKEYYEEEERLRKERENKRKP